MSTRARPSLSLCFDLALAAIAIFAVACAGAEPGSGDPGDGPDANSAAAPHADAAPGTLPGEPDAASTGGAPDAAPPSGALTPNQQALFDAINAERTSAGIAVVALRDDLDCAAQAHSDDIGPAKVCAVVGTDGSSLPDRVAACAGPSLAGGLVGCGYLSGSATAAGWAGDAGTRAILLDPALHFVGVGERERYWTAIFDR